LTPLCREAQTRNPEEKAFLKKCKNRTGSREERAEERKRTPGYSGGLLWSLKFREPERKKILNLLQVVRVAREARLSVRVAQLKGGLRGAGRHLGVRIGRGPGARPATPGPCVYYLES